MKRVLPALLLTGALWADAAPVQTNALIHEHSPYLKMHAHNPVDWYPYGEQAFAKAKREDKLIFLSIGFSTCHWCHVMEKESFENGEIAALLNRDYVSVKVDKEEMPQIDTYFQQFFARLQHRRNGWPLSIIMTPDREILYMSTYIPDSDRYGVPGMRTLLPKFAKMHRHERAKERRLVQENLAKIQTPQKGVQEGEEGNIGKRYVQKMWRRFDKIYKGFDGRPHFPMASNLMLLLEIYGLEGEKKALQMADETLTAMAQGGIYDQVEGGFFRYATDPDWVIPHFEKMLYTNAELLQVYLRAWLLTGNPHYRRVVTETIAHYHMRLEEDGLFYAATDADSMGEEGGYFTYRYGEVMQLLRKRGFSKEEAENLLEYFDISDPGNFKEDRSNVQCNTGFDAPPARAEEVHRLLRKMRAKRTYPFVDKKIVTSWNAMMARTLIEAGVIDPRYRKEGLEALEKLMRRNIRNGRLRHYTIGNADPKQNGLLEDYAFLTDALITAYEATCEKRYLDDAQKLAYGAMAKFYDGKRWYLNEGMPRVTTRYLDKYYTTPLARMLDDLLRIAALTYDRELYAKTRKMVVEKKGRILEAFDRSPHALHLLLRLKHGDIVMKATRAKLLAKRVEIAKIAYPFLLTKEEKSPLWLLCDMESCFFYDQNFAKVVGKIGKKGKGEEK